jgi:hypothetical protein
MSASGGRRAGKLTGIPRHAASRRRNVSDYAHEFEIINSIRLAERRSGEKLIKTTRPGRDGNVRVTFTLPVDDPGGAVSVVGSFNDWNPYTHPLRKRANRTRSAAVTVQAGTTLHFRYLAEGGVWFDDETVPAQDARGAAITV